MPLNSENDEGERASHMPAPDKLLMSISDTLAMPLPAIEQLIGPLYSCAIVMIAGDSGVGKSLFSLQMAARLAAGQSLCRWDCPNAMRVLYVDGEMAPQYIQSRLDGVPNSDNLRLIHLETMRRENAFIDFSDEQWREWFLQPAVFNQFDVFFFDTVSSLLLTSDDISPYDPNYWLQLESWHQKFRAHGKTVVWIDNLNKNGEVFGTSVKHHKVDAMWSFEKWKDLPTGSKTGFKIFQKKMRGDNDEADSAWYCKQIGGWFQEFSEN